MAGKPKTKALVNLVPVKGSHLGLWRAAFSHGEKELLLSSSCIPSIWPHLTFMTSWRPYLQIICHTQSHSYHTGILDASKFSLHHYKKAKELLQPLKKDLFLWNGGSWVGERERRDLPPADSLPKWQKWPGWSQEPTASSSSGCKGTDTWNIFCYFPWCTSKDLDWKWSSWDSKVPI